MYSKITCLFFLFIFLNINSTNAKIAILGSDSSGADEFNFVSDELISAGTVIYFSEDEYDAANDQFLTDEGLISYVVPAGGLPAGRVVVITEVSSNTFTADDGGTVTSVSGNYGLSSSQEEITAFSASNPASPHNSITAVFCWFILDGTAGVGSNEDPSLDFSVPVIQNWNSQIDRAQYIRDRSLPTTLTDIQNATNWSFGAPTATMNSTDFTGTFVLDLALPVELSNFKANRKEQSIQLLWETQSEINNQGFEIQRSTNNAWHKIDFINGNGNSTHRNSYSSIDKSPIEGINYYRLKQLDFDGKFEYSDIISVEYKSSKKSNKPTIYPNPVIGKQVNVIFPEEVNNSQLSFQLFSVEGKIIKQWERDNSQDLVLDLDGMTNGIYFLEIRSGYDVWRERLMLSGN